MSNDRKAFDLYADNGRVAVAPASAKAAGDGGSGRRILSVLQRHKLCTAIVALDKEFTEGRVARPEAVRRVEAESGVGGVGWANICRYATELGLDWSVLPKRPRMGRTDPGRRNFYVRCRRLAAVAEAVVGLMGELGRPVPAELAEAAAAFRAEGGAS